MWDEAFYPLATGVWSRGDVAAGRAAVAIGSLTKVFACPGLRVGYVLADPADIARLAGRQPRWALNGLAAALVPDLLARADLPAWAAAVARRRAALAAAIPGVEPSDANFVLVAVDDGAAAARDRLARAGRPGAGLHQLRAARPCPHRRPRRGRPRPPASPPGSGRDGAPGGPVCGGR